MISRRRLSQTLLALGAASSLSVRAKPSLASEDFASPIDVLRAFVKLRGSLDSELVIWSFTGTAYGIVDQKVRALWGLRTAKFEHFERLSDASYGVKSLELTYPFDLKTGERIKTAVNPYNEQDVELGYGKFGPNELLLTESGFEIPPERRQNFPITLNSSLGLVTRQGDDIWLKEDTSLEIPPFSEGAQGINASDVNTYHGDWREVADDNIASANATMSYTVVLSWHGWMKMGARPGHMMRRMAGKKLFSQEALPAAFLADAQREHPDVLANAAQLVGLP